MAGTINIGGLATGLDTNSIVTKLVALEQQRAVDPLTSQQSTVLSQQSAIAGFGTRLANVLAAVDKLRDPTSALARTATSSDTSTLTATAGAGALNGTTEITVDHLARASIATSANGASSVTASIASGSGSFSFQLGSGAVQTIAVDGTTTLETLATAINALGVGASASVVNLGTAATPDYRLRLASRETGTANQISIVADNTTLGVSVTQGALDASFTVDGFATPFTRSSNLVNDVIPGVTLSLQHAGGPVSVTVATDTATVAKNVQGVVDSFNDLVSFVNDQSTVTQDTSTSDRSIQKGPLAFDGTVRTVLEGLRTAISSSVSGLSGQYSLLADVGLTSTKDGTLALDGDKLASALAADEGSATQLFSGNGTTAGVFQRVHDYLTGITGAGGLLDARNKGITASLDSLSARIADGQRQVDAFQANLQQTFTNLEVLVSQLNSQSAFLTSALGKTS